MRRALRDDQIRAGISRPRTTREMRIFEEGQAERAERLARRIARAKRKQASPSRQATGQ